MIHTSFAIMKLFFQESPAFSTNFCQHSDNVYQCCKIPCLYFGAHHEWYTETLNTLQECIHRVCPNQNMEDVLLLHENAWPHISLRTHKAIAKMGWTVLPHPAHSPDLAPSNYHLSGPVQDALCACHFADDKELTQSFRDVLQSQGTKFYNTGIQHLTQCWQKCAENDRDFGEK
jgi:hypothetical protein